MNTRPLIAAGITIGIGMGGFVDGILFHQILQLHNMLSARIPPNSLANVEQTMVWDGIFHALTWMITAAGIALLWRAARRRDVPWSGRIFCGSLLAGWGIFNAVEGLIDHQLLGIHHVVEKLGLSIYDYLFLASGLGFIVLGYAVMRARKYGQVSPPLQSE